VRVWCILIPTPLSYLFCVKCLGRQDFELWSCVESPLNKGNQNKQRSQRQDNFELKCIIKSNNNTVLENEILSTIKHMKNKVQNCQCVYINYVWSTWCAHVLSNFCFQVLLILKNSFIEGLANFANKCNFQPIWTNNPLLRLSRIAKCIKFPPASATTWECIFINKVDNFICCKMHSSMSIAIMKRSNTLFLLTATRAYILREYDVNSLSTHTRAGESGKRWGLSHFPIVKFQCNSRAKCDAPALVPSLTLWHSTPAMIHNAYIWNFI
jgi:hypothetical protein